MKNAHSQEISDVPLCDVAMSGFAEKLTHIDSELQGILLGAARQIGRSYSFDEDHALQVTRLALKLFAATALLHGLSENDREILMVAAMLHDIGISISCQRHHKHSCSMIVKTELPGFSRRDTLLAALVARYHRKSEPKSGHEFYSQLADHEQKRVAALAAILRIADVLDRDHLQQVKDLTVLTNDLYVEIQLHAGSEMMLDRSAVDKKSRLFEKVFSHKVKIS